MTEASVTLVDLRLAPPALARCATLLSPKESARAGRFQREADRARYVASHAALRLVLARETGDRPEALAFRTEAAGRPFIPGSPLDFNLSHSGDHALIGLVRGARIGVDVEARRPLPDALRIARNHFAPDEAESLAHLPPGEVEAAFFELWTRKEAVVKALGAGLSMPLAAFSVTVPPAPARLLRIEGAPPCWTLAEIAAGAGIHATAAVTAPHATLRLHALAPGWPDAFERK